MNKAQPPGARRISCARCGKPTLFTPENPFRPFCSERCKLIDLGNWADGHYAIPVSTVSAADLDQQQIEEKNGGLQGQNADQSDD